MHADYRLLLARLVVAGLALAGLPVVASAQNPSNYDEVYAQYLAAARNPTPQRSWMNDLTADLSARHVNDLVTIRVLESLSATGSADSNVNKGSSAAAALPGGKLLSKYVPASSDTKFKGSGGTTRTTELSATLTARVVEVLPSGDLVVEGVREVDINGDRSVVVLSGVVRQTDILPGNVVPSTQVGQLRIRSLSQGLIQDSLSPGWLIRVLNKIF
jgi:flagellar L-ring protein precursor FlgH